MAISHHYDHLDVRTIKHLTSSGRISSFPGAHLDRWPVPSAQFIELDWWQSAETGGVTITGTPVRHYSDRGLRDGNAMLWSSWVIAGPTYRVYFSGGSGFGEHFKAIGDRLGPFDLSILKIGTYEPGQVWHDIHMEPEEAVKAHIALRARRMLPCTGAHSTSSSMPGTSRSRARSPSPRSRRRPRHSA